MPERTRSRSGENAGCRADNKRMMHYGKRHWLQYERQAEPQYDEGNGATVIDPRSMTGRCLDSTGCICTATVADDDRQKVLFCGTACPCWNKDIQVESP